MANPVPYRLFGVRHHGPGSARSLLQALEAWEPDALLIEGPPEGDELLPLILQPDMEPPVALLAYVPGEPRRACFYPYAVFSPEWQALQYGLAHGLSVHFMDLPLKHWLAVESPEKMGPALEGQPPENAAPGAEPGSETPNPPEGTTPGTEPGAETPNPPAGSPAPEEAPPPEALPLDTPLDRLARAAGYPDGESWWEEWAEERGNDEHFFEAMLELMTELRATEPEPPPQDRLSPLREAAMRTTIRATARQGFQRIAVVCGAWHAPALLEPGEAAAPRGKGEPGLAVLGSSRRADQALLKGLPRLPVAITWVPWNYGHLSRFSGYGAGINSPGWYEHLWLNRQDTAVRWLGRVAHLLRGADLDASAAQVIDAARLAEALASMHGRPRPGLAELNEATMAVFCFGNPLPLQLIGEQLVVGERLGHVPAGAAAVPLQQDLEALQKKLRLPPDPTARAYDLDLRQPNDLARSHLLHRLNLLGVPWGQQKGGSDYRGTFHENWVLQWDPTFAVAIVDASVWGNTVVDAATARAQDLALDAAELPELTRLLETVLLADLERAIDPVITLLQQKTALSGDIAGLMEALPPLARTLRYGNVRQSAGTNAVGTAHLTTVVDGIVTRICIGLPLACASLDDDAARAMLARLEAVHASLETIQREALAEAWQQTLVQMADQVGLHGVLAGRCCRLLLDKGVLSPEEAARRLGLVLSPGSDPARAAAWLEGFLRGSGQLLLHDMTLWSILDEWVAGLAAEAFIAALPLLRRTFSSFSAPERRMMGERVARGSARAQDTAAGEIDEDRANAVLGLLAEILGLGNKE